MRRGWAKLPPVMQRTLADDVRWALFVVTGALLAYLLLGAGDASTFVAFVVGALFAIVVLNVVRRVRRRP